MQVAIPKRKSNVKLSYHRHTTNAPMLCVKSDFAWDLREKLTKALNCTDSQLDHALNFWFETAQEQFWYDMKECAVEIFGNRAKVYSAGRSGGWLVVEGLPDVADWNAIDLAKWRTFAKLVQHEYLYLHSYEYILDTIESNRWHEDGSELYNFVDRPEGTACIVDLKTQARNAGLGAVIRS